MFHHNQFNLFILISPIFFNLFYEVIVDCLSRLEKETNRFEVTIASAHPLTDDQKARLLPLIEKKMSLKM